LAVRVEIFAVRLSIVFNVFARWHQRLYSMVQEMSRLRDRIDMGEGVKLKIVFPEDISYSLVQILVVGSIV